MELLESSPEMQIHILLARAFEKRESLFSDPDTNCFRLFNGEADGCSGLTIDIYGEFILIQYFSPHLVRKTNDILQNLNRSLNFLPVKARGILLKQRTKPPETGDVSAARKSILLQGSLPPAGYAVRQNGVAALVDLVRGQSTGIFLDMREVRTKLASYYRRSDIMLNLFCYTALFSVHAVKHGIAGAVNVDISKRVLERAKANYALNHLRIDDRDFIYGDALDWIRRFHKKRRSFSFIIFDPPTFSRSRTRTFSSLKNYKDSLSLVDRLIEKGYVFTSINSYSISADQYKSFHPSNWKLELYGNESSDFTRLEGPYLKAGLWKIKRC
ncbi:MAG: hypothetical protein A2W19_14260 [Spirochaetes bacterium RBG_16_49_21]|nr:MAG: hypothetical protein A2W19_14260 [Spirochaetes bacterium RBG_16_49_21]